ncbi:MAG: hypothetical protein OXU45_08855 [Candidatus Melainabacteria bacterium]|nr:hypothetical protein [Candidatus Melainabacteria bacterium]
MKIRPLLLPSLLLGMLAGCSEQVEPPELPARAQPVLEASDDTCVQIHQADDEASRAEAPVPDQCVEIPEEEASRVEEIEQEPDLSKLSWDERVERINDRAIFTKKTIVTLRQLVMTREINEERYGPTAELMIKLAEGFLQRNNRPDWIELFESRVQKLRETSEEILKREAEKAAPPPVNDDGSVTF